MSKIDFDDVRLSRDAMTLYIQMEQAFKSQNIRPRVSKHYLSATTTLAPADFEQAWNELQARELLPKRLL